MFLRPAAVTPRIMNCPPGCLCAILCAILCSFILGCGSSEPLARLSCHVSRGDQPLAGAELRFELTGAKRATISAVSLADGSCYIDLGERKGLPPGDYRITVTQYETVDGQPLPGGEEGQALKSTGKARRVRYEFSKPLAKGQNTLKLKIEDVQPIVEAD